MAPRRPLPPLGTALEAVIENRPDMPSETRRKYLYATRSFLGFAGTRPSDWTYAKAEDWKNALLKSRHPKSVKAMLSGLQHASRAWARREQKAELDFAAMVEAPKIRRTDADLADRRAAIPEEEAVRMLAACVDGTLEGIRDRAILLLGFRCGVRRRGISAIEIRDLKPDPRAQRTSLTITLKGGDRHRFFPDDIVVDALQSWIDLLRDQFSVMQGPMFYEIAYGKPHRPITVDMIYNLVKRRATQAQVTSKISPHVMRHSFISYMVAKGEPNYRIQEITGQKSEEMIRLYTTDLEAASRPAGSVLSDRLR